MYRNDLLLPSFTDKQFASIKAINETIFSRCLAAVPVFAVPHAKINMTQKAIIDKTITTFLFCASPFFRYLNNAIIALR